MNNLTRKSLSTFALAAALMGVHAGAQAKDGITQRIATGVGRVIAAQGNAALLQIRDELRERLEQDIEPLLPEDVAAPAAVVEPARELAAAHRLTL